MVSASSKRIEVGDYETTFITQENVDFLCKGINLLGTGNESEVILDPCSEDEWVNMASPVGT